MSRLRTAFVRTSLVDTGEIGCSQEASRPKADLRDSVTSMCAIQCATSYLAYEGRAEDNIMSPTLRSLGCGNYRLCIGHCQSTMVICCT